MRPWRQELNGKVLDRSARDLQPLRARHAPLVHDPRRREGARSTSGWCGAPASGSLYGNVDILGKPTRTKGRKGIIPQYRLISSLRLHPRTKTLKLRTGAGADPQPHVRAAGPQPRQHDRADQRHLPAVAAPARAAAAIKSVSVVPGKLVTLGLTSTSGFKKGRYTITASLSQGGKRFNVRTSVTLR